MRDREVVTMRVSPYFAAGMLDGIADAQRNPRVRHGYDQRKARSWQYKRGFARGFLMVREIGEIAARCVGQHPRKTA